MEFFRKATTTIDKEGRVRIPVLFRKQIEERYGREVFITSLDGKHIQIFSMEEWRERAKIAGEIALKNPVLRSFLLRINRSGIVKEIDSWGRIMIHKELRVKLNIQGKVIVEEKNNHLILR